MEATQWITWALQGLIATTLMTIWKQLQLANKSIEELRLLVVGDYVKTAQYVVDYERIRQRVHVLENWKIRQEALTEQALARTHEE